MSAAIFTAAHGERLAEKLRESLEHELDRVASNDGEISGIGWERRKVCEMSDAEVSAFLAGLRAVAQHFADWFENHDEIRFEQTREGRTDLHPVRKHGATCAQIDEDIAGAEGECLFRRDPERHAFAGRLRKFNEQIARIRRFRVELDAAFHEGARSREAGSYKALSDLAYQWLRVSHYEIHRWLSKLEWSTSGLDDEQRAACSRTKHELNALNRFCDRKRAHYSDQLKRESERTFANIARPAAERSAA